SYGADDRYRRGPADFGGGLKIMETDNGIALFPTYVNVMHRACDHQLAWDAMRAVPAGQADARDRAAQKGRQTGMEFERALRACRVEEDKQRDVFAAAFRPIGDDYAAARTRQQQRLQRWRDSLIASHVYAREGKDAIAEVYGDGRQLRLDGGSEVILT